MKSGIASEREIKEIEERIKKNRRDEVMQLYDSLDERRQYLLWVHIRALSGKGNYNGSK